jgi:hypothetical protein
MTCQMTLRADHCRECLAGRGEKGGRSIFEERMRSKTIGSFIAKK